MQQRAQSLRTKTVRRSTIWPRICSKYLIVMIIRVNELMNVCFLIVVAVELVQLPIRK